MAELKDRWDCTLKEIYSIYVSGILANFSSGYLEKKHWVDASGKPCYPLGEDNDGDLVWLPQDSTGRNPVIEQDASTIKTLSQYNYRASLGLPPYISAYPYAGDTDNYRKRIGTSGRLFNSNAAGGLDADVTMIAAVSGFYSVIELGMIRSSANVAAGSLIFHDTDGNVLATINMAALTAYVPNNTLEKNRVFIAALTDNKGIVIDTTSHDLGNTTYFQLEYIYWWET